MPNLQGGEMGAESSREPEIIRLRKFLPIFLPTAALMTAVCIFSIIPNITDAYHDIVNRSPIIRITIGYVLVIPVLPLMLLTSVVLVMKSVSIDGLILNALIKIINYLVFISALFLLILVPAGKYYEYLYLEGIGYHQCNQLRGRPTMWFNDWVKNPEWCVRGKDRAWVLEQAQLQAAD